MRFRKLTKCIMVACLALSVGACSARVANRGNQPDPALIADIASGGISKQEIREILGSPSSANTFGQETWYYISEITETLAFFEPEVKERQVLIIKFDDEGKMQALEHLDLKDGRRLAHIERVTPTFGQELTVVGQIIGNFRRFTGKKK